MEIQTAPRTFNLSSRAAWWIAILLALLQAFMAVTAVNTKSPTFDEPQHLTAGYSYWVANDFRLDPENGNLPVMWAALPLLFESTKFIPLKDRGWQRAEEGRTSHQFFYEAGNDPDLIIAQARVMMSIFGAALCLLVFRIAREFFGLAGGLLAELICAFDPNFLAHNPLVDSDVPATFFFTATVWTCWRLFQKITPARLAFAALSVSGLFLTKFSAPVVLPILGALWILQVFSRKEVSLALPRFRMMITERWKKAGALTAASLMLATILFLSIWGAYSFRYDAWTNGRTNHEGSTWHWSYLLEYHGPFENSVNLARAHHLLPEAYLYGLAYVRKHEIDRPAFLDNEWSIVGFRSFFPKAFLYKTPLPFLFLLALAIYGAISNRHSWKIENVFNPLWGFALLYGGIALTAQLNIGHRHLLPIYPALFVACGAVVYLFGKNQLAWFAPAVALLLAWQIGESLATRPHYLAYFNQVAGGPARGYEHLVDSSLDWGQDLPALKAWIDNHKAIVGQKPLYLGYFGTADPRAYDIQAQSPSPENQFLETPGQLSGGTYCISATTLQSVYAMEMGTWCAAYESRYQSTLSLIQRCESKSATPGEVVKIANGPANSLTALTKEFERMRFARLCAYLRHQRPTAQIGHSIFVFQLSDEEANRAIFGSPAELAPQISVTGY